MSLCAECGRREVPAPSANGVRRRFCSPECKARHNHRLERAQKAALADQLRDLLGLPARGYGELTRPELETALRRLRRLVPAGGLSHYPATRRRR